MLFYVLLSIFYTSVCFLSDISDVTLECPYKKNHATALVCVAQQPQRGGGVGPACHAKPLL